jgi:anti-sigma B factor antagonist
MPGRSHTPASPLPGPAGEHTAAAPSRATAPAVWMREIDGHTAVIAAEGELDLAAAPRLKWILIDALESGHGRLVLDLSATTFMDSTALGVLVGIRRRLGSGEQLAIACPRAEVLNIFEFAGVDAAFAIFSTLDDALANGRGHAAPAG